MLLGPAVQTPGIWCGAARTCVGPAAGVIVAGITMATRRPLLGRRGQHSTARGRHRHAPADVQVQIRPAGNAAQGFRTNAQDQTRQRLFTGQGADSDIVVASTRAYVAALNKMISHLAAVEPAAPDAATVDEAGAPAAVA